MSVFHEDRPVDLAAVGAVDAHSARLWLRARTPGAHVLEVWPEPRRASARCVRFEVPPDPARDGTRSVRYPHDFPGTPPLAPATRYGFSLFRDASAELLAEGSFETAPIDETSAHERFSFAFMSCHQPFDENGLPHPAGLTMLRMLDGAFRERNVQRVLLLGDQMYSDCPKRFSLFDSEWFARVAPPGRTSLFDCTREEVRALYQTRYRAFWALPEYQRLLCRWPSHPIPDDHELFDNFGSHPEHASVRYAAIRDGALDACHDYQMQRVLGPSRPPSSFHFSFTYGPCAVFVLDLRSQRFATEERVRIYDPAQLAELAEFLEEYADRPVVYVGLSVPLVHIPDWVANTGVALGGHGTDAADRWEFEKARQSRDDLVQVLAAHRRRHPDQILLLLGGDIHTGVVSSLELAGAPPAIQAVSSAVTNLESAFHRGFAHALTRMQHGLTTGVGANACEARLLAGERGARQNPYAGLNVGVVEHRRIGPREWRVRVELLSCRTGSDEPEVVFGADLGSARCGSIFPARVRLGGAA